MREGMNFVTQSKYFSPAFNAAIFDGPVRIYFAQYQESQALKLYFNFQQRFADVRKQARGIFKNRERNIFVMLYPTDETFDLSFGAVEPLANGLGAEAGRNGGCTIISEQMGDDYVVGVRGPLDDTTLADLCTEMDEIVRAAEV